MPLTYHLRHLPKYSYSYTCRVSSFGNKVRYTTRNAAVSSAAVSEPFEIPKRIPRTSTDILQALAGTVKRDPTAAHYKYHDDPYLIPMSNVAKKTYAMSQEAGRKAAKWIKEEHRDLFMHQEAQPAIEAFAPRMIYTEDSEVDIHTLDQLIAQGEVSDAVIVYNIMQQKRIEINKSTRQNLLELVCFYNNQEPIDEDNVEERWFLQNNRKRDGKTWKDGDLAEKLFTSIEPKTPQSYAALIRGMAKYNQFERAYALFQEATEKQFELDTNTFNAIIEIANFLKETADQRWQLCNVLLQQLCELKLKPNLGTLNALLGCISTFGNYKLARSSALKTLSEFKKLGVEPSLGTYYYLLIIFCRERGPVSHVIVDILNDMAGKEFTIAHVKDTYFFATAMDICRNHLHDKSLALKVNDVLHTGNNYDLIGDSYKESVYYRHYLALLCQTEPIEKFMETYDLLVPNIYTPEPGIMEEILRAIEFNGAVNQVPRIWSDMIIFDHIHRESLLLCLLRVMVDNRPSDDTELPAQLAEVALSMYNKIEESANRTNKVSFTGQMLGDMLTLLVRGSNFEKAVGVYNYIDKQQQRITGTPAESSLQEFITACVLHKSPSQALSALQYAVENAMDFTVLAKMITEGFTLNEVHLAKLKSLVGDHSLS